LNWNVSSKTDALPILTGGLIMKILCVFGKFQYGDPTRGVGTEYAAFVPALRRLGHEVVHFDLWDRALYQDFRELNVSLLNTVELERPDVMLAVPMHYEIWLETLQVIKARGDVATVCWTTDDSWKYERFSKFIGGYFHAITTTYVEAVPKYLRDGIPSVLLTQWAANAEALQEPTPSSSCKYPISFVGAAHGKRKKWVDELRLLGLNVVCFGHGWPAGSLEAEAIPTIMNNSIISLNFSNSTGENQIKARVFEVPGAGGFLLTEGANGLSRFYLEGQEIVTFCGINDLLEKARYYLEHPKERDAVAWAGFERTRREHTYDLRVKKLLDFTVEARNAYVASGVCKQELRGLFEDSLKKHQTSLPMRLIGHLLTLPCILVWGRRRGQRAARRILFELSWRLAGKNTYSASGLPGRLFYKQS